MERSSRHNTLRGVGCDSQRPATTRRVWRSSLPDTQNPVLRARETITVMTGERKLQIEGRLRVIEMTGAWNVYTGERIVIGPGESFRDDLGIKIREMFEDGAAEALRDGRSPSERFELPRVRVTIELVSPVPSAEAPT
jgi:uncharacterized protein (DUF3084 family)